MPRNAEQRLTELPCSSQSNTMSLAAKTQRRLAGSSSTNCPGIPALSRMELFMKRVYLATVIAVIIASSIAYQLLMAGSVGSATPGLLVSLRSGMRATLNRLKRLIAYRIAVALARRQRRAAIFELRHMTDRELMDIGVYRGDIPYDSLFSERDRKIEFAIRHRLPVP
jgi:uncharacterized protein YjiS (DUF1127 family)